MFFLFSFLQSRFRIRGALFAWRCTGEGIWCGSDGAVWIQQRDCENQISDVTHDLLLIYFAPHDIPGAAGVVIRFCWVKVSDSGSSERPDQDS